MGDSHVGLQARLMSQALRKITGALNNSSTTAIFINQLREKIGVMFGSPETTTGGKALKFYASVRLDVRRIETLKDGTDAVGNRTRVKVVKNKVAPPFKQAEFDIMYGQGISREGGLIDMGVEHGFVRKSGAWYTYEGDQLGQGKENARKFLRDNPDLADEIEKKIKEKLGIGAQVDAPRRPRPMSTLPSRRRSTSDRRWRTAGARRADPYETARADLPAPAALPRRTRAQLAATLARKGVEEHVAADVLDRLEDVGLVDDAAYADGWVGSRHVGRGLSRRAIGQELARRGVADEVASEALDGIDGRRRGGAGTGAGAPKLPASRGLDLAVRTRRLVGMLARKGYPPGLATRVVREQLALEADVDPAGRRFLDDLDGPLSDLARLGE